MPSIRASLARGAADPRARRTEFRCACGYGIVLSGALPACPMCKAELWEQIAGPQIVTSRSLEAAEKLTG
jgi:hypothetical protein